MNENYLKFIEQQTSPNSKKVARKYSLIGEYNYTNITDEQLIDIIIQFKPRTKNDISNCCGALKRWGEHNNYALLLELLKTLDKNEVLKKARPYVDDKYFSYSQFKQVMRGLNPDNPDEAFENNTLYYRTLFWCLYEGIYNGDMSVLTNLRASDISGNIVTLRENDGNMYEMEIPPELANNCLQLSQMLIWERKCRGGAIAKINISGIYSDSCFKAETKNATPNFRAGYFAKLKKITNAFFDYKVEPLDIYVSGIMHRIAVQLKDNNIELEDAFKLENRKRQVHDIISNELNRCNYNIEVRNFRKLVYGHCQTFAE